MTLLLLSDLCPRVLVASAAFEAQAAAAHRRTGVRLELLDALCPPRALPFAAAGSAASAAREGQLRERVASLDAGSVAAVFFTGGTTGTPKAVPHTHAGLLWWARASLQAIPEPFETRAVPHAGTACFTPYFHVSLVYVRSMYVVCT